MNGIIERYNDAKGFGFIAPLIGKPGEAPPVFFHITAVRAPKGQRATPPPVHSEVRFDVVRGKHGQQAANIQIVRVRLA